MIPPNAMQIVKDLHAHYQARTGYVIAYNLSRENTWREWCSFGNWSWTCDDLSRVIGYLRKKIAKGERNEGALKFFNLIGRPDNFEEDLNLAREEAKGQPLRRRAQRPQASTTQEVQDPAEAARSWREQFKPEEEQS